MSLVMEGARQTRTQFPHSCCKAKYEGRYKGKIMDDTRELKPGAGKVALLVEDNEINAEIAMLQLKNMGFEVEWVANGARAVENFGSSENYHYSLVIMDIMMPVMDGLEATCIIRKLGREDAATVPIVAITANAFPEDKKASFENGVTCFITKPYSRKQLQEVIESLFMEGGKAQ